MVYSYQKKKKKKKKKKGLLCLKLTSILEPGFTDSMYLGVLPFFRPLSCPPKVVDVMVRSKVIKLCRAPGLYSVHSGYTSIVTKIYVPSKANTQFIA
jgi:hypothetical protein